MSAFDLLLGLAAVGVAYAWVFGRHARCGWIITLVYAIQFGVLLSMGGLAYSGRTPVAASFGFQFLGQSLHWRLDAVGWFFALITLGVALLASGFMAGEWGRTWRARGGSLRGLHLALALNVFAMLVLLASGDLLSLFIGWELVSWASYLLMALDGARARDAALRYLTYALAGAMAILAGIVLLWVEGGDLAFDVVARLLPGLPDGRLWLLVLLFASGFGIKMGLLPFHLWQPKAYALTPGPGAAFLGAISSRMGLFALLVVVIRLFGLDRLAGLSVPFGLFSARDLLAWVGVLTIVLPTFTALRQQDARRLLAWHGVGQTGYTPLGVAVGSDLASAGGLMHVFNHASYQALLFLVVAGILHRTGTTDLNRLGGLVARMPLSFFLMLVGIIGLAGLPPMNGFVSKWMIYRALIDAGSPLLFIGAVIGTLGTILSVYKLLHNCFLGQLRLEHQDIEELRWTQLVPMLLLAGVVFVTGWFPGLVLDWVGAAQAALGLPVLAHTLGGVARAHGGLDMIWLVGVLLGGFGVGALVFLLGGRAKRVHPLDNYAGGHFLDSHTRYQYSDDFYAGLMHRIGPWYRGLFQRGEEALVAWVDLLSLAMQGLYRQARPALWLVAALVVSLSWVLGAA